MNSTLSAGLLAPMRQVRKRAARLHKGTITVDVPDTLWATDATKAWTRDRGRCAVFVIVDHASNEVWYDAARRMDRFAAADLLREVCAPALRVGRAGGRRWAGAPIRRRLLLPQRPLPGGDRPPRHRPLTRLPLRTRNERGRREGAADAGSRPPRLTCVAAGSMLAPRPEARTAAGHSLPRLKSPW